MKNRTFQLDKEWNIIYYPDKPVGFGVLILGDERHFVDELGSFWTQNEGKHKLLKKLTESGYTSFTSNLYGRNWGSERAAKLAGSLYSYVMKTEIMNDKIHILAEGMGALTALALAAEMPEKLRSIVLINPVLSLKQHAELEKEHKFFFKKLMREISRAYQVDITEIEKHLLSREEKVLLNFDVPVKIFHILSGGRAFSLSRISNDLLKLHSGKALISSSYLLPEKTGQLGGEIRKFFTKHEKLL